MALGVQNDEKTLARRVTDDRRERRRTRRAVLLEKRRLRFHRRNQRRDDVDDLAAERFKNFGDVRRVRFRFAAFEGFRNLRPTRVEADENRRFLLTDLGR